MNKETLFVLGAAAVGGAIIYQCLPRELRNRLSFTVKRRITKSMENMMAALPESAPPKLVMSTLPKLQVQNEQIIALLREQNELLRDQQHASAATAAWE